MLRSQNHGYKYTKISNLKVITNWCYDLTCTLIVVKDLWCLPFSAFKCPDTFVYSPKATCIPSCLESQEETEAECAEVPDEGCVCEKGKVEKNGKCVPAEECLKPTCAYPMGNLEIKLNVSMMSWPFLAKRAKEKSCLFSINRYEQTFSYSTSGWSYEKNCLVQTNNGTPICDSNGMNCIIESTLSWITRIC